MSVRKAMFWMHLAAGVVAGVIVLVMSVTGILIAYERQLLERADRDLLATLTTKDAQHLSLEALLAKAQAANPNVAPTAIILRADPVAPLAVTFGRERLVFVDRYSGEVLGEGAKGWRDFFHLMTDWHRWLGCEGEGRAVGKAITGACNFAFLFLIVSGVFLWWPRNWKRATLRGITLFNGRLRGKARDWNWHNVLGFWSALPLFFIVLTGVVMSYPWANNLVYRLAGSEPPPQRGFPGGSAGGPRGEMSKREGAAKSTEGKRGERKRGEAGPSRPESAPAPASFDGFDKFFDVAKKHYADWQAITLRFPSSGSAATFSIERGHRGRPDLRSQLAIDSKTSAVVSEETFASYNLGRRVRTWMRWIHTGEAGGFLGQTLAALASAGAAVLVWTGLALTWRRFFGRKPDAATSTSAASEKMDAADDVIGLS